jgi:hypothetical protein
MTTAPPPTNMRAKAPRNSAIAAREVGIVGGFRIMRGAGSIGAVGVRIVHRVSGRA